MAISREEMQSSRVQYDESTRTYFLDGQPKCLRPNRHSDDFCTQPAGMRTDHYGKGGCYLHGGSSGRPPVHGRYAKVSGQRLRQNFEEFLTEIDASNLMPELAVLRSSLAAAVEEFEESGDLETLELINKISNSIVTAVQKIHKINERYTLTANSGRLMMLKAIETQKRFLEEWFPGDEEGNKQRLETWLIGWRQEVERPLFG